MIENKGDESMDDRKELKKMIKDVEEEMIAWMEKRKAVVPLMHTLTEGEFQGMLRGIDQCLAKLSALKEKIEKMMNDDG